MKAGTFKTNEFPGNLLSKGYELERLGQHEEADACYRSSIESLESGLGADEGLGSGVGGLSTENLSLVASYAFHHGTALESLGKPEHAAAAYRRSIEIWDSIREDGCTQEVIIALGRALAGHARAKRKCREYAPALESYTRARGLFMSTLFFTKQRREQREEVVRSLSGTLMGATKAALKLNDREKARFFRKELRRLLGQ